MSLTSRTRRDIPGIQYPLSLRYAFEADDAGCMSVLAGVVQLEVIEFIVARMILRYGHNSSGESQRQDHDNLNLPRSQMT